MSPCTVNGGDPHGFLGRVGDKLISELLLWLLGGRVTPIVYAGEGRALIYLRAIPTVPLGTVCVYVWGTVTSGLPHGPPEAHRYHTAASTVAPKPEFPHEFLRTPNYLRLAPRIPRDPKLPQGCPTDPSGSKNYLRFAPRIPRGPQLPQDCPHGSRG